MRSLAPAEWNQRFQQQTGWTQALRRYLYDRIRLANASRVLDLGCGTGALLPELAQSGPAQVFGLDLLASFLALAAQQGPTARLVQGDAHRLPFPDQSFEVAICHFLLLWVASPQQVLQEMHRVVRPGGVVVALAEPDYGGRIDYPSELARLGQAQTSALEQQGADPHIGRRLSGLFQQAGLAQIESGILGGQWQSPPRRSDWDLEWQVLESDLASQFHLPELERLKQLDWSAWQRRERVLFVPTFYALGYV